MTAIGPAGPSLLLDTVQKLLERCSYLLPSWDDGRVLERSPGKEPGAICSVFCSLASLSSAFMNPKTICFPHPQESLCTCIARVLELGDKRLLTIPSCGLLGGPPAVSASWQSTRSLLTRHIETISSQSTKLCASYNNHEEACKLLCGKGRVRTQDLGYQSRAL